MIHEVHIIHTKTGLSIVEINYSDKDLTPMDSNLLHAFLNAIYHFSAEFSTDQVSSITMGSLKLVRRGNERINCWGVTTKDDFDPSDYDKLDLVANAVSEIVGPNLPKVKDEAFLLSIMDKVNRAMGTAIEPRSYHVPEEGGERGPLDSILWNQFTEIRMILNQLSDKITGLESEVIDKTKETELGFARINVIIVILAFIASIIFNFILILMQIGIL